MVLDSIKNKNLYVNMHPLFKKAFDFIEAYIETEIEPGVYEICGEDMFAKVQEYDTRSDGAFEVHNKYIDIQYIAKGTEKIEYGCRNDFSISTYDEKEDFLFLQGKKKMEFVLNKGEFVIFFPNDAHKPSLDVAGTSKVIKVVLKVKVKVLTD